MKMNVQGKRKWQRRSLSNYSLNYTPAVLSAIKRWWIGIRFFSIRSPQVLVQSLNSTFFPPHIGAEPGRAKEESRITCMRMLRTPPFFPPKSGEKPYLVVFSRFGLWRDFLNDNIQATIFVFMD